MKHAGSSFNYSESANIIFFQLSHLERRNLSLNSARRRNEIGLLPVWDGVGPIFILVPIYFGPQRTSFAHLLSVEFLYRGVRRLEESRRNPVTDNTRWSCPCVPDLKQRGIQKSVLCESQSLIISGLTLWPRMTSYGWLIMWADGCGTCY